MRKIFNVVILLMFMASLIIVSGCGSENDERQSSKSNENQPKQTNQVAKYDDSIIKEYESKCAELVKIKMDYSMKRNEMTKQTLDEIEQKFFKNKNFDSSTIHENNLYEPEHILISIPRANESTRKKLAEIEDKIYKDIKYEISTSHNNNDILVTVSLRCVDDIKMQEKISKAILEEIAKTYPDQYKEGMSLMDVQHAVEAADLKKQIHNRNIGEQTEETILNISITQLLKGYEQPIYLDEPRNYYYHFKVQNNDKTKEKMAKYLILAKDKKDYDINDMFWFGASTNNSIDNHSIERWISLQYSLYG